MFVEPGSFKINKGTEQVYLQGNYDFKIIGNGIDLARQEIYSLPDNIPTQMVYVEGNVLYRTDTENVDDLINLFIRYTYDPCKDLEAELDFSVKTSTQMLGGTICPTKKILFVYKKKVFVAYGRYIFGYNESYVKFKRQTVEEGNDSEEEKISLEGCSDWIADYNKHIRKSEITNDKIILGVPEMDNDLSEYVYSFLIYDQGSSILDVFGLYR